MQYHGNSRIAVEMPVFVLEWQWCQQLVAIYEAQVERGSQRTANCCEMSRGETGVTQGNSAMSHVANHVEDSQQSAH